MKRSFIVTMGQAFRDTLPNVLTGMGHRVVSSSLDESSTLVRVRVVTRKPVTASNLQDAIWEAIPGPSVSVR